MSSRRVPGFLPTHFEIVLVLTFLTFSSQVFCYDVWWHLSTGREILAHGAIPAVDHLSTGSAGTAWTLHYWGWCALAAWIEAHAGLQALLILKGCLAVLALICLARLSRERGIESRLPFFATVLIGCAGLFSQFFSLRAQNATGLGVCAMTWLMTRAYRTGCIPWILAPLTMLVWTNAHGGFVLGIAIYGAFLIAAGLRAAAGHPAPLDVWRLLALGVLIAAACSVNPRGPAHLLYPFSYLGNAHLQTRITEWAGTVMRDYPALELTLIAVVVSCAAVPVAATLEELALATFALHFVFQAVRNAFLIGPWLAPLVGIRLQHVLAPHDPRAEPTQDRTRGAWLIIAAIAVFRLGTAAPATVASVHPVKLCDFLEKNDVAMPLFNEYSQGGYVMYRLAPRVLPYVDGRADLHIDSGAFVEYMKFIDLSPGWDALFAKRGFRSALLEAGMPIGVELKKRGWTIVRTEPGFELLTAPR